MIRRGTREYATTTALTAAALVMAALASILAGTSHGSARVWWIVANLVAVVSAVVAQAIEQRRRERERQAAEAVAVDMRVAMNDALDPIVRQLGKIAVSGRRERDELREQTVPMVLYSAALLIGPDRVRACWFRLDDGSPRALRPVLHEGRAGGPRTTFVEGTVAGDSVLELLTTNSHRFCEDVRAAPPPGWDRPIRMTIRHSSQFLSLRARGRSGCSPSTHWSPAISPKGTCPCCGCSPACSPMRSLTAREAVFSEELRG